MQVQPSKHAGLVADLQPNIRLMRFFGHFMFRFSSGPVLMSKVYSGVHLSLFTLQYFGIIINLMLNTDDVNELSANTITTLFFTHCMTKFIYLGVTSKSVFKTFSIWNTSNSHPLFAESDARYHSISLKKSRKVLYMVMAATCASVLGKPQHFDLSNP